MPRWIPPDPETQSALNISFEIQMLGELPRWVMRFDDDNEQIPKVACQEATLLHARALMEFLFGRPQPRTLTLGLLPAPKRRYQRHTVVLQGPRTVPEAGCVLDE
jgi:hypothetical protein